MKSNHSLNLIATSGLWLGHLKMLIIFIFESFKCQLIVSLLSVSYTVDLPDFQSLRNSFATFPTWSEMFGSFLDVQVVTKYLFLYLVFAQVAFVLCQICFKDLKHFGIRRNRGGVECFFTPLYFLSLLLISSSILHSFLTLTSSPSSPLCPVPLFSLLLFPCSSLLN